MPCCDLTGDDGGVFARSEQQRRLALAQEVHADEVQPVDGCAGPFVMEREPELVNGARDVHPRCVVGAQPAGEDHRAEPAQINVLGRLGAERGGLSDLRQRQCALSRDPLDKTDELRVTLIGPSHGLCEIAREPGTMPLSADEVAKQRDAHRLQRPVVQVVATVGSRGLHVGSQPSGRGWQ